MATIFKVTIHQSNKEDKTLIFSTMEQVSDWLNNYRTSFKSYISRGTEWADIIKVEVDTNKVITKYTSRLLKTECLLGIDILQLLRKAEENKSTDTNTYNKVCKELNLDTDNKVLNRVLYIINNDIDLNDAEKEIIASTICKWYEL